MGTFTLDAAAVLTQATAILTLLGPIIILSLGIKYGSKLAGVFRKG